MKRMLVDMSSLCWTSLLEGKDTEHGYTVHMNGRPVQVNSAIYGYEKAVDTIIGALNYFKIEPSELILVVEGVNSKSFRSRIHPDYKNKTDSRTPEMYTEFGKMRDMLCEAFGAVGAHRVTQANVEADDVIAYLAKNLEGEVVILSNDGDLSILVNERVTQYRLGKVLHNATECIYGPFDRKYITLYKALVGDTSDKIPGAKGFGDKAWLDLLVTFGEEGLAAMENLIKTHKLADLQEDVPSLKALQRIIDNADMVYTSYKVALLYPDKVNTLMMPLEWQAGMVKPAAVMKDERLKPWAGQARLVDASKFDAALKFFQSKISETPYFTLDIETTTPEESDEWLMKAKGKSDEDKDLGVDVFGSTLVGCSVTFGANRQYTYYMPVKHSGKDGLQNLTSIQVLTLVDMIPLDKPTAIQNVSFELTVLHQEWSHYWDNGDWQGFIPNAHDTKIMASYVDENQPKGLKQRSLSVLGYQQQTFDETVTEVVARDKWDGVGRVVGEDDEGILTVKHKMDELSATQVFGYGADDTICTSALYTYYRMIMEIEKTWQVFLDVEVLPAYVTALAYVQGCNVSLERLRELEKEDDIKYEKAKEVLDRFLIEKGWEGTVCPKFDEITPAAIKQVYTMVTGEELKTQTRTVNKFVPLLDSLEQPVLARIVENNDVEAFNRLAEQHFSGEVQFNYGSPKQIKNFLYGALGLPVRIVNKLTPKERQDKPALASAVSKFNKIWQGSTSVELTDEERELLKDKASTDDTAIAFAMQMDADEQQKEILEALTTVKMVNTRRGLYYNPYPYLVHWKDGKLHSSMNQSEAATRRYTSSGPNLQQLSKKGDGVKIREIIVPHCKDGVICSIDFVGQELRLMATQSRDENMLACYIGNKLKDIHSITASGAMAKMWTQAVVDELASKYGTHLDKSDTDYVYDLFVTLHKKVTDAEVHKKADDLRKTAKNVNFAAQFDAQAAKLAQMLIISVSDAQTFLDAKYNMFPRVETWKDEVRNQLMSDGYVTTMLGGRRHLREQVISNDKWEAERAGRQGPNFKIQGSAAEMTKLAIGRVWSSGVLHKLEMRFIAPIHDELVWSVSRKDAIESIKAVHTAMTQPYADMIVPILGSISVGPNFGKQIECGDSFDADAVQSALDSIS